MPSSATTVERVALIVLLATFAVAGPDLGKAAPDFELPGSDGSVYRLSEIVADRPVVLAWFPKAFTGG